MSQALAKVSNQQIQQADATPQRAVSTLSREDLVFFANMIETAQLVPVEKNVAPAVSKARVMAKIVAGAVYGFDPITSQNNLSVLYNRIGLNAQGLAQLLHRSGRYTTRQEYLNNDGCKLSVLKKNDKGEWTVIGHVEFTRAMAERAGLTQKNENYSRFGPDMFFAKCITRVVKRFAPDVLDGDTVVYDLAKKEVQQLPAQPVEAPAQTSDVYSDPVATDIRDQPIEDDSEAEFTEVEPIDRSESIRADLETAANDLIKSLTNGDAVAVKRLLKGRQISNMTDDELVAALEEWGNA